MSDQKQVKVMCLIKRKPGMSMEDFIDYYENKHATLILRILPFQVDYRRNYVHRDSGISSMDGGTPEYDVVTEAWFPSREAFEQFSIEGTKPEIRDMVIADEMNFIDRDSMQFFVVEEYHSVIAAPAKAAVG